MPSALITGSGSGLGSALALSLAQKGYDLFLHAHLSVDGLANLTRDCEEFGVRVFPLIADLSTQEGQDKLVREAVSVLSSLDLVIHNASVFEPKSYNEISRLEYRQTMALGVDAPFFITQGLLLLLSKASDAQVIHMLDAACDRPYKNYAHYLTSKAALAALTRVLSVEFAPKVRVNAIAPGVISFPQGYDDDKKKRILDRVPLKRKGAESDVVKALSYLLDAPYVTGQILTVDGGRSVAA